MFYAAAFGMLSVVLGTVLKAVTLDGLNKTAFFVYSQWLGIFGMFSYILTILNMVLYFKD